MPKEFLNGADVIAVLEEMGCEGMAKSVTTDAFLDARFLGSLLDSALQAR